VADLDLTKIPAHRKGEPHGGAFAIVNTTDKRVEITASYRDQHDRLLVGAEIPGYPGWRVVAAVDDRADPAVIVQITILPEDRNTDPPRGITADVLRAVRFGPLIDTVNSHLAGHRSKPRLPDPTRARARTDEYYASVAALYDDLVNGQQSKNPNVVLADKLNLDRAQVRDLILACRTRGLLTKAPAGRPGGRLTDKAVAILEADTPKRKTTRRK